MGQLAVLSLNVPDCENDLHSGRCGGAGESRTPDLQFRKLPLYPAELQPRPRKEFNANEVTEPINEAVWSWGLAGMWTPQTVRAEA
jgi:hypothetical protein